MTATMTNTRRGVLKALALTLPVLGAPPLAIAQDPWPSKPLRIVVPFAPGGAGDVVTRLVAARLSLRLNQPVVVDNKPGAGGSIGPGTVARSAPDGYTLAFVSSGYAWLAATYPGLSFDPAKDLQPVALICSVPYAVITRPDAPFKTFPEFVAYAKANPGRVSFASAGAGTLTHLLPAWVASEAGINLIHVPFGGTAPAMNSLVSGQTDIYFDPLSTSKVQLQAGRVRVLATTGTTRPASFNDAPTLPELGYAAQGSTWFGIMAPKGVPRLIVDRLNREINAVLQEDEVKAKLHGMDFSIDATTVEKFGGFLNQQMATWAKVIKENGIKSSN